jgi:hypothetical protein
MKDKYAILQLSADYCFAIVMLAKAIGQPAMRFFQLNISESPDFEEIKSLDVIETLGRKHKIEYIPTPEYSFESLEEINIFLENKRRELGIKTLEITKPEKTRYAIIRLGSDYEFAIVITPTNAGPNNPTIRHLRHRLRCPRT